MKEKRTPLCASGVPSLSKKCKCVRSRARASQSSVVRRRRNQMKWLFFPATCASEKNTARPASVRAQRVRRSRLHLFSKMLAFLREAVDFVDSLSPPERRAGSSLTAAGCRLLPENEVVHILRPPLPAALRLPLFHGPRPLSPNGRSGPVYAPPGPPVPVPLCFSRRADIMIF